MSETTSDEESTRIAKVHAKVRWAILGTARIATGAVIPAIANCASSELVAIGSRSIDKAKAVAARFRIPRAYDSYEEVLSDAEVEAVYIPLPNHLHVPWAIRCAEAGKHVLCEKPIALSVNECKSLIVARDRSGVLIGEAFAVFSHPQWRKVMKTVSSGEIGRIRVVAAQFTTAVENPRDIRNVLEFGGGAMMDIGCYPIKAARLLFGEEPISVLGTMERDPKSGIDTLSSGLLRFASGHCTFSCTTQGAFCQRLEVLGTAGRIEIPMPFITHPAQKCRILIERLTIPWRATRDAEEIPACDQFSIQIEQFSSAIRERKSIAVPLEDSIKNMAVIEAVFESAKRGTAVR